MTLASFWTCLTMYSMTIPFPSTKYCIPKSVGRHQSSLDCTLRQEPCADSTLSLRPVHFTLPTYRSWCRQLQWSHQFDIYFRFPFKFGILYFHMKKWIVRQAIRRHMTTIRPWNSVQCNCKKVQTGKNWKMRIDDSMGPKTWRVWVRLLWRIALLPLHRWNILASEIEHKKKEIYWHPTKPWWKVCPTTKTAEN